jgi:hypothetical protein
MGRRHNGVGKGDDAWVFGLAAQLRRDGGARSAATATEFAIIAMPFAMMLFGVVSVTGDGNGHTYPVRDRRATSTTRRLAMRSGGLPGVALKIATLHLTN